MNQTSAQQQASNLAHAGFLVILLSVMGAGVWLYHVVAGQLQQQAGMAQQRHAAWLGEQLQTQHPGIFHQLAQGDKPLSDPAREQLRRAYRELVTAAVAEFQVLRLVDGQGAIQFSSQSRLAAHAIPAPRPPDTDLIATTEFFPAWEGSQVTHWLFSSLSLDKQYPQYRLELLTPAEQLAGELASLRRNLITTMLAVLAIMLLWLTGLTRVLSIRASAHSDELERRINYDQLTGLTNRVLFWDRLGLALAHARRDEKLVALIRINIDRFQRLNHALGHAMADHLLEEVAQRLKGVVRASDTLTRMCADDFAVIIGEIERKDEIEKMARRLLDVITEPYALNDHDIDVTARIGIAVYPVDQLDPEKLLIAADAALKQARHSSAGRIAFYDPDMGAGSADRLREESALRNALLNQQFELHYQPKVDSTTGVIKGFEALIRWRHPERGLMAPLSFIPLLEESGLIVQVGEWVIREACLASKRWQQQGLPVHPISVNVSAPQFEQPNFTRRVGQILTECDCPPAILEIEITESCLMSDVEMSAQVLRDLKAMGLAIAVDDFGTGYSSLSHLKRFPIDTLKIDRSFVSNINNRAENDNASIVTAIMALSHSLRLDVVAEGVETARELAYLHALGCRTIQGFLFSRPLREEEVISLLEDSVSMQQILASVREELKL